MLAVLQETAIHIPAFHCPRMTRRNDAAMPTLDRFRNSSVLIRISILFSFRRLIEQEPPDHLFQNERRIGFHDFVATLQHGLVTASCKPDVLLAYEARCKNTGESILGKL